MVRRGKASTKTDSAPLGPAEGMKRALQNEWVTATFRYFVNLRRSLALINFTQRRRVQGLSFIKGDLLRAGVVLLHATFEDYLRSLARLRLPDLSPDKLEGIRYPGNRDTRPEQLSVQELAKRYADKSVRDLVRMSVNTFCDRLTLNSTTDVTVLLERLQIDPTALKGHYSEIAWLMARRHQIVHRADTEGAELAETHAIEKEGPRLVGIVQSLREVAAALQFAVGTELTPDEFLLLRLSIHHLNRLHRRADNWIRAESEPQPRRNRKAKQKSKRTTGTRDAL